MQPFFRRSLGILATVCVFFALATGEASARGKKLPPPKIPYTAIVSVDRTAMTITTAPMNTTATGTKTYKFTAKTEITVNGKPGTAADLTPGQQIHVGAGTDETRADRLAVTAPPADPQYIGHEKKN